MLGWGITWLFLIDAEILANNYLDLSPLLEGNHESKHHAALFPTVSARPLQRFYSAMANKAPSRFHERGLINIHADDAVVRCSETPSTKPHFYLCKYTLKTCL